MQRLLDEETVKHLQRRSIDLLDLDIPPLLQARFVTEEVEEEQAVACPATKLLLDSITQSMDEASSDAIQENGSDDVEGNVTKGLQNEMNTSSTHTATGAGKLNTGTTPPVSWRMCPAPSENKKDKNLACKLRSASPDSDSCLGYKSESSEGDGQLGYKSETEGFDDSDDSLGRSVDLHVLDQAAFVRLSAGSPSETIPLLQLETKGDATDFTNGAENGDTEISGQQASIFQSLAAFSDDSSVNEKELDEVIQSIVEADETRSKVRQGSSDMLDLLVMGPEVIPTSYKPDETGDMVRTEPGGSYPPRIEDEDLLGRSPRFLKAASPVACRMESPSFFMRTGLTKKTDSDSDSSADISPSDDIKPDESVQSQIEIDTAHVRSALQENLTAAYVTSTAAEHVSSLLELSNQRAGSAGPFLRRPVFDQFEDETGTGNSENSKIYWEQSNLIPPFCSNDGGAAADEPGELGQTSHDGISKNNRPAHFEYAQRMRFRTTGTTIKTKSPEQGTDAPGKATNQELQEHELETTTNDDVNHPQSEYHTKPTIPEKTSPGSSTHEYEKLGLFNRQASLVQPNGKRGDIVRTWNEDNDEEIQENLFSDISFWSVPIPTVKDSELRELPSPKTYNISTESHADPVTTVPPSDPSNRTSFPNDSSNAFLDSSDSVGRFVVSNEKVYQETHIPRDRKQGESDSPEISDQPKSVTKLEDVTELSTPTPTRHHEVNDALERGSAVLDNLGALDIMARKVQEATDRINDANRELCMQRIESNVNPEHSDLSVPIEEDTITRVSEDGKGIAEIKIKRKRKDLDTDQEQEPSKCQRPSSSDDGRTGFMIVSPALFPQTERQEQDVIIRRSRSPTPTPVIVTGPSPQEVSGGMDVSVRRSRSPTPTPIVIIMTPCQSPDLDPFRRPVSSTRRSRSRERRHAKRHRSLSPREKAVKSPRSLSPRAASTCRSLSPGRQQRRDRLMASPYERSTSRDEAPRSPSPQPTRIPGPTTPNLSSPRRDPSPVPTQRQTPLTETALSQRSRRSRSPSPLLDTRKPKSDGRRSRSHSRSPRPENALSPHPPSQPRSPKPDLLRASRSRPGSRSRSPGPGGTFRVRHDEYADLVMAQQETLATNLSISSEDRHGRKPRQKLIHKDSKDQNAILEQLKTKYLPYLAKKFNRIPESGIPDVGFILDDRDFINALDALRRAPFFVGSAVLSEYSYMQDVYQQVVGFPSIFRTFKKLLEILFHVFTEGFTAPEIGMVVVGNIYTILINGSDVHEEFSKQLSEEPGLLELIIWFVKRVKNVPVNKDATGMLLTYSINVLYNCSMHDVNRKRLQEVGTVDACLNYLESPAEIVQLISLLCVAYLADEKQSEIFLAKRKPLQHFIDKLKKAVTDGTVRGADGWSKLEIIKGLGRLSVNDSNTKVIADCGAIDVLLEAAQVDASSLEKLESLKVLWSLCFDKTNKEQLKNNTKAMAYFEQTGDDDLDPKSQKVANGILWTIRDSRQHHAATDNSPEGQSHIMISYQWDAKPLALKMRDTLRANGFNVWMDVDHMQGSTIETMARAVEISAAVLMCMSQKYKESQNCRSEAEYAYYQKKEIIPIVVQNKYRPDGWLGLLRGTKMYYDITSDAAFQEKMAYLMKALGNKGKLQVQGSPLNVPPHHAFITEQQETPRVTSPALPVLEGARTPRARSSPRNWGEQEVASWMESHGINRNRLGVLTGRQISFLQKMKRDAPDFYYSYVTKNLYSIQFQAFTDFSALTSAIDELGEAEK